MAITFTEIEVFAIMNPEKPPKEQFVEVSVSTTAGFYPAEGTDRTPIHQKISVILQQAKNKLNISDVTNWVLSVTDASGHRELDPQNTYLDSGLSGTVEIDWGPREGGGGC